MRRTLLAVLTVTAAFAALPATSLAATADGGTLQTSRTASPGAGKATSTANADGTSGALRVSAQATGGRSLLPLPLPGNGPANAAGVASVSRFFEATAGTYRVTITHTGASQTRTTRGAGAADVIRTSVAQFVDGDEEKVDGEPNIRFERNDLPSTPGTVRTTLEVTVPEGESGAIFVRGGLLAQSTARRQGDSADVRAQVARTTFDVTRVD